MSTTSKTQMKTQENSRAAIDSASRGSIITIGVASALGGLWAIACITSAMFGSGSPLMLIKEWFGAVSGIW